MHLHGLIAMFLGLSAASVDASELVPPGIAESSAAVFKLSARNQTGRVKFGSAVLVAPGRLLTTCHVARDAESIQVHRGATKLTAILAFMDIEHDLCVLSAPELMEQTPVEVATAIKVLAKADLSALITGSKAIDRPNGDTSIARMERG